jgi:hypothetical protein
MDEIVNKVAASGLVTLDLKDYYAEGTRIFIDIKDQLWQGLALKEKDFREFVKTNDWDSYNNTYVAIGCTADAIIPNWAYMLLASALAGKARKVVFGDLVQLEYQIFLDQLSEKLNLTDLADKRVIVKGCSDKPIPTGAYVEMVNRLQPVVKSIMFGEPCSTVPVFKKQ